MKAVAICIILFLALFTFLNTMEAIYFPFF